MATTPTVVVVVAMEAMVAKAALVEGVVVTEAVVVETAFNTKPNFSLVDPSCPIGNHGQEDNDDHHLTG